LHADQSILKATVFDLPLPNCWLANFIGATRTFIHENVARLQAEPLEIGHIKIQGLRGIEWVILEVENSTKLGIARRFCILAELGIRHE